MTAEELIIGHYEKTLTSDQESNLAVMVASSPDVRNLYEQHGNVHNVLVAEAAAVKPSSKLDKVVVGAALGTLVEIAGHGIGFSILGKVATIVGALAVGGIGFVLYDNYTDDATKAPTPGVVNEAQTTQAPVLNDGVPPVTSEIETPTPTETPSATTDTRGGSATAPRPAATTVKETPTARPNASTTSGSPRLGLDNNRPDAVIRNDSIKPRPNSP